MVSNTALYQDNIYSQEKIRLNGICHSSPSSFGSLMDLTIPLLPCIIVSLKTVITSAFIAEML